MKARKTAEEVYAQVVAACQSGIKDASKLVKKNFLEFFNFMTYNMYASFDELDDDAIALTLSEINLHPDKLMSFLRLRMS